MTTLKRTPCNGCRERKRKCSYEQPCARCIKAGIECKYTIMPSPKDLEYIQELEYMKQIDDIQHQINSMENELAILKLAQENETRKQQQQQPTVDDYPSPVSLRTTASIVDSFIYSQDTTTAVPEKVQEITHILHPIPASRYCPATIQRDNIDRQAHIDRASAFPAHRHSDKKMKRHRYKLLKSRDVQAQLSRDEGSREPWVLTVKNGNMTLETHITSYSQLMSCLHSMVPNATLPPSNRPIFPFNILPPQSQQTAVNTVISILIWRKYGKSRLKSMTRYTPTSFSLGPPQQLTTVIPVEGLTTITMQLVFTYCHCLHLLHFNIYIPEFVRLFMSHDDGLLRSSAVMALCSNICQFSCKHLDAVLPRDALPEYALYYFEQARELVEDRFDQIDLETLMTYTFMAVYKIRTKDEKEADRYLSMAERLYNVLLTHYKRPPSSETDDKDTTLMGETILFSRLYRCMTHARSVLELQFITKNMFKVRSIKPHRVFELLDNYDDIEVMMGSGDSERERQFCRMGKYIRQLKKAIKDGAQCATTAGDFPSYVGVFGHHIEMAMRHWYRIVLPKPFQLSLPLFEDQIEDLQFFTTLEQECGEVPIALLTTAALYNEYLVMAKSYVPKDPHEIEISADELIERYKDIQYSSHPNYDKHDPHHRTGFWLKVILKMRYLKHHFQEHFTDEELELSDEEYFTRFIRTLNPSKVDFDMPFVHTSIKAALNMVRLVQFMLSKDYVCFLDLRWVMNAWEILLRAARFRYQQPNDPTCTLDRVRANLILCLSIIEARIAMTGHYPSHDLLNEMKDKFKTSFS
ncbi:MAG: hypothetical protein EXX96DRAFT_555481 [Benjaminiella poitrasii]|nr:MAG: hypothetical protein EXX96DRAFT_555481 [Benjaminiella poitrasii]